MSERTRCSVWGCGNDPSGLLHGWPKCPSHGARPYTVSERERLSKHGEGYDVALRDVCAWLRGAGPGYPELGDPDFMSKRALHEAFRYADTLADELEKGAARGASSHGDSDV